MDVLTDTIPLQGEPLSIQNSAMSVMVRKSYGRDLANYTMSATRDGDHTENDTVEIELPDITVLMDAVPALADPGFVCSTQVHKINKARLSNCRSPVVITLSIFLTTISCVTAYM